MTKKAIILFYIILLVSFFAPQLSFAATEKCGDDHELCQAVRICEYYNKVHSTNKNLFEIVVGRSSNDFVKLYCEWQIGIQLADGTVVVSN